MAKLCVECAAYTGSLTQPDGQCIRHAPSETDAEGYGKFPIVRRSWSCFEFIPLVPEKPAPPPT